MAGGIGLYNAPVYNEAIYNDGTGAVLSVVRPRQVATSGRPLTFLVEVDPVLMARPEAALLRGLRQAQRSIGRRQRS